MKADNKTYGYDLTLADFKRGDIASTVLDDAANSVWIDLDDNKFALYSKTMGLYLREVKRF